MAGPDGKVFLHVFPGRVGQERLPVGVLYDVLEGGLELGSN